MPNLRTSYPNRLNPLVLPDASLHVARTHIIKRMRARLILYLITARYLSD